MHDTAEHRRIGEITDDASGWRRWGPYLSDRAWATVREDYSPTGDAWNYLPHDLARSKTFRWGEDGIAGVCDRYQVLCFAPAFWNGKDPILKERLFGLTPHEGNHGEDVKEYYFHLDNTPTHSYMKLLYKYPQAEFPYALLVEENRRRLGQGPEFELLDTGVFADNRYFDIFIEYAKASPEDLCVRIEAVNRGPEPAELHILPHLWFRNIWAWDCDAWRVPGPPEPVLGCGVNTAEFQTIVADDSPVVRGRWIPGRYHLGSRYLYAPRDGHLLFTDNETNGPRVYGPHARSRKAYVKDAFHRHIVGGEMCINPSRRGTKAAAHYHYPVIPPGGSVVLRLRLTERFGWSDPLAEVDDVVARRRREADEFYEATHPPGASADERLIQRQALAGLLWTKQSYIFDVAVWQEGDCGQWAPAARRQAIRNAHWPHLNSLRVMTMPDKWEYPWFAAWDLAFQCVPFALIDPQFAKDQLAFLLFEQFQHPNGQIPAYEWEFSDLNPPVHAWAVWRVYNLEKYVFGRSDRDFLEKCFHKLMINFAWWINKVDRDGHNVFEGGFLGLDNISIMDRSDRLPGGAVLEQADATGWMGMFCLVMMRIALELAKDNRVYEGLAIKYFQHYTLVAAAMKHMGNRGEPLWDQRDGFFYDMLRLPGGESHRFRVRSLVGLIPLFAVERLETDWIQRFPDFTASLNWYLDFRRDLCREVVHEVRDEGSGKLNYVLTIVNDEQLRRLLERVWDEGEFLSPYGVRSLSKHHEAFPFWYGDRAVAYEPGEAVCKIKGGNSNWRGPIWFPTAFLLIESLRKLGKAYGPLFTIRPSATGGRPMIFPQLACDLADRLIGIFTRDEAGRRAVFGGSKTFQEDPHWRDHVLFYEYFHGDSGAGLGASHQTGWTALVATLIDEWR